MMKLLFSLFALMGFVAAEVPAFSAADDYDELNLNIRMLEGHNSTTPDAPKGAMQKVSMSVTMTLAGVSSIADITDAMKSGMVAAFVSTIGSTSVTADNTVVDVAEARLRARKLSEGLEVVATFTSTIPAGISAADTFPPESELTGFSSALMGALGAELESLGVTVSGVSAASITVTQVTEEEEETETAPTAAPTAPASEPAAASNSVMMSANIALIAAAALSSFF